MKILINVCYGGFGFSEEAAKLYLKKYKDKYLNDDWEIVATGRDNSIFRTLFLVKKEFCEPDMDNTKLYSLETAKSAISFSSISYADGFRTDPLAIEVFEELGSEKTSGSCAKLQMEEIAPGTLYRIDEYDGNEFIEYSDNTFWLVAT